MRWVFGPVRSRRFGVSLGVNFYAQKICNYSCVYCQLGRTLRYFGYPMKLEGIEPETLVESVERSGLVGVDYVTVVPSGEPLLWEGLGKFLYLAKNRLGERVKIAVITNGSLIFRKEVREPLLLADAVSVKMDALDEKIWKRVNRPFLKELNFGAVVEGIENFVSTYEGRLMAETMLVEGVNDDPEILRELAKWVKRLGVREHYFAAPVRAPAESWVKFSYGSVIEALGIFEEEGIESGLLVDLPEEDIVGLTSAEDVVNAARVHPVRLSRLPKHVREEVVRRAEEGALKLLEFGGEVFVLAEKW